MNRSDLSAHPESGGQAPAGKGWFVLNAGDAVWAEHPAFGSGCRFEGENYAFPETGINLRVVQPGQPACLYHEENRQEDFFVLWGEGLLVVEGQEQPLRTWDFVHCPAGTKHVLVGAGEGSCGILMIGSRGPGHTVNYPVEAAAARHGASVQEETDEPPRAYAPFGQRKLTPSPWAGLRRDRDAGS
ncbi:MAG TPA: cupin domain-containing protein [Planctomycetota bacterium]